MNGKSISPGHCTAVAPSTPLQPKDGVIRKELWPEVVVATGDDATR